MLLQFLSRFLNPLVIILLVASVVSAFTGEFTNFIIISVIVLLSVTLDFVQEYRANAAADKLRQSVSVQTTVLRDSKSISISVSEIVPGDIVLLAAGDLIPADSLVLESSDFFVKIISCCFQRSVPDLIYHQYGICRMYSKENPKDFRLPVPCLYP